MNMSLPGLEVHMVVITPCVTMPNITAHKKYIILDIDRNRQLVKVSNDKEVDTWFRGIDFIDADTFYVVSLLMTFNRVLRISQNPLYSLDK